MRLLSCRIHCPFICFCKPSPHVYSSGPPKLQSAPQLHSSLVSASDQSPAETTPSVKDDGSLGVVANGAGDYFKSSLKKGCSEPKCQPKKQVQWMDFLGKELVEIREYESSEVDDTDREGEGTRGCICVIL